MWYRVGQSSLAASKPDQAAQVVRARMSAQLVVLPKVACQLLGLAVLWVSLGLLLLLDRVAQRQVDTTTSAEVVGSRAVYTALPAVVAWVNFVGLLSTALHWVYTTFCLVLLQTGSMVA